MKLELAPRAVRDAERHARWWRENRPAARLLFDQELAARSRRSAPSRRAASPTPASPVRTTAACSCRALASTFTTASPSPTESAWSPSGAPSASEHLVSADLPRQIPASLLARPPPAPSRPDPDPDPDPDSDPDWFATAWDAKLSFVLLAPGRRAGNLRLLPSLESHLTASFQEGAGYFLVGAGIKQFLARRDVLVDGQETRFPASTTLPAGELSLGLQF